MHLTKIDIDFRRAAAREALLDAQVMHKALTALFGTSRKDGDILYRLNHGVQSASVYVYSNIPAAEGTPVDGMSVVYSKCYDSVLDSIRDGMKIAFSLEAVPSIKKSRSGENDNGPSRRKVISSADDRLSWLARKGAASGFDLVSVEETEGDQILIGHSKERGGEVTIQAFHYAGTVQITDAAAFRKALQNGIGPERAYGAGMMMISF